MRNAKTIYDGLKNAGYSVSGGVNAPYIWLKTPGGMSSWEFFDYLLEKAKVVGTPGSGFGAQGEDISALPPSVPMRIRWKPSRGSQRCKNRSL